MSRRAWLHLALAIAGVAVVIWAVVNAVSPSISCRGVPMGPGDTCRNAEGTKVQTYEDRLEAVTFSTPVMIGTGVVVAGFGAALFVAERRRTASVVG
ncbi:MAG: hypothetical protein Q4F65_03020 [Propionibacteriaceae bacterium]|nr:hypothetical protein [Propionibacteriaceae bacterium]